MNPSRDTVADVAHAPAVTCRSDTPVSQVARLLGQREIGCVIVVDDHEHPIGVVTDRDLVVRALATGASGEEPVGRFMTNEITTTRSDRSIAEAAQQMAARSCRRLPVVDDGGVITGMVSFDDLFATAGRTIDQLALAVRHEMHPVGVSTRASRS